MKGYEHDKAVIAAHLMLLRSLNANTDALQAATEATEKTFTAKGADTGLGAAQTPKTYDETQRVNKIAESIDKITKQGENGLAGAILRGLRSGVGAIGRRVGSAGSAVGSAAMAPMTMLLAKFAAVLGPIAIFAMTLNSATSGFTVLTSAVKLLAATLAPILLPVVAVLAAGFIELSDRLWGKIVPALGQWYQLVVGKLLPVVREMVDVFMHAVEYVRGILTGRKSAGDFATDVTGSEDFGAFVNWGGALIDRVINAKGWRANANDINQGIRDRASDSMRDAFPNASGSASASDWLNAQLTGVVSLVTRGGASTAGVNAALDARRREDGTSDYGYGDFGGGDFGDAAPQPKLPPQLATAANPTVAAVLVGGKSPPDTGGKTDAWGTVVRELQTSLLPKASFSGITQASKNAQLAALNESPIDQMMLQRLTQSLAALERIETNTRKGGLQ